MMVKTKNFHCENGAIYSAPEKCGLFCKHCTDIVYDYTHGPYMLMCESHDTDEACWEGECDLFEPDEEEEVDDLIQHVGYDEEQCGRTK